jgi:transposase
LSEAETHTAFLSDKVKIAQRNYAALDIGDEESAIFKKFNAPLDNYLTANASMMNLSRQNKLEEMRELINTRIKLAVVADEVRALAHRTQRSTRKIEQMVAGIQRMSCRAWPWTSIRW